MHIALRYEIERKEEKSYLKDKQNSFLTQPPPHLSQNKCSQDTGLHTANDVTQDRLTYIEGSDVEIWT